MAKEGIAPHWTSVDQTVAPGAFVNYLDTAGALEAVQAAKHRTFALLEVKEGHHLLDVGCGTGDDVRTLAQMVGKTGRVVGVDSSETMLQEARQRADGTGLSIEFRVGNAQQLDFADNTFDGCRAERTFQHLDNPRQALAEMIRVTRPGGRIVVLDPDRETRVVDVEDRLLTRKILNYGCDSSGNGWMGRQLLRLFKEAHLTDIAVFAENFMMTDDPLADHLFRLREMTKRAQTAGVVSETEANQWVEQLEQAQQAGQFFFATTVFFVSGRKPG
jgi:ubiquinone/menaquinone biosynthesis C-methylase UbiE